MRIFRTTARRRWPLLAGIAAVGILTTSCNWSLGPLNIAGGGLTGVGISGDSVVAVGDTIRLNASGDVDGLLGMFSYDPLSDAKWTIENRVLATLTPRPPVEKEIELSRVMVRGMRGGTTYVTVSARGFSARHAIRVRESGGVPWSPESAPVAGR